ncbi:hypothetical protein MBLNU459_g3835t2 [Dothideomycetes sp. NU459]
MNAYDWPLQNYKITPGKANAAYPADVASADWLECEIVQSVLVGSLSEPTHDDDFAVNEVIQLDCAPYDAWVEVTTGEISLLPTPTTPHLPQGYPKATLRHNKRMEPQKP